MKCLLFLCLFFTYTTSFAQTCEQFDRRLFHGLPRDVPDNINCKDIHGKKQGWWIYYKVGYNTTPIPDVLDTGNYVSDYTYGQYNDDKKIGQWFKIGNIHLIAILHSDSFYTKNDTTGVYSSFEGYGYNNTDVKYSNDSTIINVKYIDRKDTVSIYCDRNAGCKMTRGNNVIKEFPITDFEGIFLTIPEQIENIDEKAKFKNVGH